MRENMDCQICHNEVPDNFKFCTICGTKLPEQLPGNSSFVFKCPFCKQKIEAEDAQIGLHVECPSCNREITVAKQMEIPKVYPNITESNIPVGGNGLRIGRASFALWLLHCTSMTIVICFFVFLFIQQMFLSRILITSACIILLSVALVAEITRLHDVEVSPTKKTVIMLLSGLGAFSCILLLLLREAHPILAGTLAVILALWGVWLLILCFLPGTRGKNRYGEPPGYSMKILDLNSFLK